MMISEPYHVIDLMSHVIRTVDKASEWLIAFVGTGKKIRISKNLLSIHNVVH